MFHVSDSARSFVAGGGSSVSTTKSVSWVTSPYNHYQPSGDPGQPQFYTPGRLRSPAHVHKRPPRPSISVPRRKPAFVRSPSCFSLLRPYASRGRWGAPRRPRGTPFASLSRSLSSVHHQPATSFLSLKVIRRASADTDYIGRGGSALR